MVNALQPVVRLPRQRESRTDRFFFVEAMMPDPIHDNAKSHFDQAKTDGQACLDAALKYISLGWSALPLCNPGHVGVGKTHAKECSSPGKAPWGAWKEFQERIATDKEIRQRWHDNPLLNVGMAYGPVSGLIGIDVDGPGGEELLKSKGVIPDTLEFSTPGGGRRLLFSIPSGVTLRTTYESPAKKQELRFQAKGAQTVMPPSRHKNGGIYAWVPGRGPGEIHVAPAPPWLVCELSTTNDDGNSKPRKSPGEWGKILNGVDDGSRNTTAASIIGKILRNQHDLDTTENVAFAKMLVGLWNERNDPPMTDDELDKVFFSILDREVRRRKEDEPQFDVDVMAEVQKSVEAPKNGHLPDWHLKIIEEDPKIYMLRSPHWSFSRKVKDGYIELNVDQVMNWTPKGKNVKKAAYYQTGEVVRKNIQGWSDPGGILEELTKGAEYLDTVPERKRELYVLGFVCRFLAGAKPPRDEKGGVSAYRPTGTILGDNVCFKLPRLRKAIKDEREDITQGELTAALNKSGFFQTYPDRSRWWTISVEALAEINRRTKERTEKVVNNDADEDSK